MAYIIPIAIVPNNIVYRYDTYVPRSYLTQTLTRIQYPIVPGPYCLISGCVNPGSHSTSDHRCSRCWAQGHELGCKVATETPIHVNLIHHGPINFTCTHSEPVSTTTPIPAPIPGPILPPKPVPEIPPTPVPAASLTIEEVKEEEKIKHIMCAVHICKNRSSHETSMHHCEYRHCRQPEGHSATECAWAKFDKILSPIPTYLCHAIACNDREEHSFANHYCNYCNKEGGNKQCIRCKNYNRFNFHK